MKADRLANESISGVVAAPDLEFTGERIVPGKTAEALFRQHEERYVFAGQYVSGKDVLDVACGTGVGTSYLRAAGARSARGLDIDPEAIAFARAMYGDCEFVLCEATDVCLPDSSIDVVVAFETLEHLNDQRGFLVECRRVLRAGGVLICSTPNLGISQWSTPNPFHIRELHSMEFQGLVRSIFPFVEFFAQRNRGVLPYVAQKAIRRALERLRLWSTVKRIVASKPRAESFRTGFVNDVSALSESISAYRRNFLTQPTFLIAVARKASA